jgi:hypothetical protein
MTTADFQIEILGGEQVGEVMRFRPGETLQGSVRITPDSDLQARHVYVRLLWHTEGRGDRDQGIAAEQDLHQGTLRKGTPTYYTFHFNIPDQPWSYAGHYVNIIWGLTCSIDLALARDPHDEVTFILAPD